MSVPVSVVTPSGRPTASNPSGTVTIVPSSFAMSKTSVASKETCGSRVVPMLVAIGRRKLVPKP